MKIALVTGANRGIGLEVARQLAAAGVTVIKTGRDPGHVDVVLDVTNADSIAACKRTVLAEFGRVDILVNNAAVLIGEDRDLLATPIDEFRMTFETNVFGAIAVAQAFVPGMVERRTGSVVNVSSAAGQLSSMGTYAPAYSISKASLNAFTVQLAAATRGMGVLVNSVNPGWVRTRMGGPGAPTSVEQGADTIVWLALQPANGPTGQFFSNRHPISW
ncbi:MAG TPA: SDR family NAD(P)-dependent oxidoreductase [Vicinamibacterales bacterium]|nr:SDR family NAD(P)-dependent oxidoreductase [Vicinamibacterales bacterium]